MRNLTAFAMAALVAGCAGYDTPEDEPRIGAAARGGPTPYSTTAQDVRRMEGTERAQPGEVAGAGAGYSGAARGGPTPYSMTARDLADMDEAELAAFETSLHDRVHGALARAPSLDPSGIDVTIDGNHVTLSGRVGSEREQFLAEEIAHTVEGVATVKSDLQVR